MTRYTADIVHGTVMEVTYEGEAHHPDLIFPAVFPNSQPPRLPRNNKPEASSKSSRLKRQRKTKKYSDYISDTIVPFLKKALSKHPTKELKRTARTLPSRRVIRRRRRKKKKEEEEAKAKAEAEAQEETETETERQGG